MKYIQLKGTKLNPSILGFGCASIMGSVGKTQSIKALQTAYDSGINYFDVARSYGYGDAEKILGGFIRGKRENIYIATKFGTSPSRKTQMLGKVKPIVRAMLSMFPQARGFVSGQAMNSNLKGNFSASSSKLSLETSLKCLGTDYVDVLFLHGCVLKDCLNDELLSFLEACVDEGKVRYVGIATGMEETLEILDELPSIIKVIQIKNNLFERNLTLMPPQLDVAVIAHSPLGGGFGLSKLHILFGENPKLMSSWAEELKTPDFSFRELVVLTFQHAVDNLCDQGIVLASMFQEKHIKANAQLASSPVYSKEQVLMFSKLFESTY